MAEATPPAQAGPSIRAQANQGKKAQRAKQLQQNTGGIAVDKSTANRSVVKAVLANPLTVPWPNIPRHLQTTVLANLPSFVPTEVAEYHTSRARYHTKEKRRWQSSERAASIKAAYRAAEAREDNDKGLNFDQAPATEDAKGSSRVVAPAGSEVDNDISMESRDPQAAIPDKLAKKRKLSSDPAKSKSTHAHPPNTQTPHVRPDPPGILDHLVLGINEVTKALERQTAELKMRIMMIGDSISDQSKKRKVGNGVSRGNKRIKGMELLPTAPIRSDEAHEEDEVNDGEPREGESARQEDTSMVEGEAAPSLGVPESGTSSDAVAPSAESTAQPSTLPPPEPPSPPSAPLEWIIIPLTSISPQTLVSSIPPYCATYNTMVYQHTHISKIARTRLPAARADETIGPVMEEVRVVPLGKVEVEMAAMVGLRRMACMGIRIETLRKLLPKSTLYPPRHSLTLPFPTSALAIHSRPAATTTSAKDSGAKVKAAEANTSLQPQHQRKGTQKTNSTAALLPHIHYAPLHVKGITTTIPADGNARKQKRMEEVRARRKEVKERKRLEKKARLA